MMTRELNTSMIIAWVALTCVLECAMVEAAQFTNTACGYTVTVPNGWNAEMHPNGRGLVLTNFAWENVPRFKLFAPGGARINIQMFPPYDNPVFQPGDDDDALLDDLAAPAKTVISRTTAASGAPARMIMTETDTRYVNTIVHKGAKVFVFMLACGTDDPNCPRYEQVLNGVIAGISIVDRTPAPTPVPTPGV